MANIFDFGDKTFEEKNENKENSTNNTNKTAEQQAKDIYNKYKNYSQSQLIEEFFTTSKEKLKNGSLTYEKLQQTENMLAPYLNTQQKEFLKGLINKLND